ncbi:hypothetical protein ACU8KH_01600 [Lachancea thermotolerans]
MSLTPKDHYHVLHLCKHQIRIGEVHATAYNDECILIHREKIAELV